jgi:hypothetical protein
MLLMLILPADVWRILLSNIRALCCAAVMLCRSMCINSLHACMHACAHLRLVQVAEQPAQDTCEGQR